MSITIAAGLYLVFLMHFPPSATFHNDIPFIWQSLIISFPFTFHFCFRTYVPLLFRIYFPPISWFTWTHCFIFCVSAITELFFQFLFGYIYLPNIIFYILPMFSSLFKSCFGSIYSTISPCHLPSLLWSFLILSYCSFIGVTIIVICKATYFLGE